MRKILWLTLAWGLLLAIPVLASTMMSIGKGKVNVRSEPNLKSDVLFQAHLGDPIKVEKQKNDWVYFTDWKHNKGWVYKSLVYKVKTAVVLVDDANIRKGPNLNSPVVAKASKGEVYKIFAPKVHWVKIGYYLENQEIGWVRDDLVWGE